MIRLFRKLKLKQIMAWLLVLCTVMSTFVTSISQDVGAASHSETARATNIMLARGDTLSTLGTENIDEHSLQIISLYLSNFYIPFATVLDNYSEDADLSLTATQAQSHIANMEKALISNLGMNRQAAEFLVQYAMSQSLNSCEPLLVRTSVLEGMWEYYNNKEGMGDHYSVGFNGLKSNDNSPTSSTVKDSWGIRSGNEDNCFAYTDDFQSYCDYMGVETIDGETYVGVSFPIFMNIMSYSYRAASRDWVTSSESSLIDPVDSYDISNRKNVNPSPVTPTSHSLTAIPRINFYYKYSPNEVRIVFSNSEECMQAYALVNDKADYEYGWGGNSICYITSSALEKFKNTSDATIKGFAMGNQVYVNWEGSLVLDVGAYRTPILPGCVNPHMLTTVDDDADNGNTIPIQNVWGLDRAYQGHIKDWAIVNPKSGHEAAVQSSGVSYSDGDGDKDDPYKKVLLSSAKMIEFYKGTTDDNTLFNTGHYTIYSGNKEECLDGKLWGMFSDAQQAKDYINSTDFCLCNTDTFDGDKTAFPCWYSIATSFTYNMLDGEHNGVKKDYYIDMDSSEYSILGGRDAYGTPILNTDIVMFDNLQGFNVTTTLSSIFKNVDITDSEFIDEMNKGNFGSHEPKFTNMTDVGPTATYSVAAQNTFRSLYFTYCFAYFNDAEGYSSFNADANIVNVKTNFDNFPTFSEVLDWSTIYTETLQEQVLSFAYYVLHPTEGINYVATLLKNKVGGFLLRCHDDMVGSTDSNSSTGMTKYLSSSSYTTTSGLNDVPWIANLLNIYDSLIVYMIILMCLVLLCYIIVGSMTLSRGVIGILTFALLSFIPPFAINTAVNVTNTASDIIYSEKFDYWALAQLETWLQSYDSSLSAYSKGDFSTYAAFTLKYQAQMSSGIAGEVATSYSGAKVKWMTPKRYNALAVVANQINSIETDADFAKGLILSAVGSATSGETYLDTDSALYLYRDYTDIYRWGSVTYNVLSTFNFDGALTDKNNVSYSNYYNLVPYNKNGNSTIRNSWTSAKKGVNNITKELVYKDYIIENTNYSGDASTKATTQASSLYAINKGFLFNTVGTTKSTKNANYYYNVAGGNKNTLASTYLSLYNENVLRVHRKYEALKNICNGTTKLQLDDGALNALGDELNRVITSDDYFNFGANQHSNAGKVSSSDGTIYTDGDLKLGLEPLLTANNQSIAQVIGRDSQDDLFRQLSSMYYSLYSESPYYFFNYNIRDQLKSDGSYSYSYPNLATAAKGRMSTLGTLFTQNNQEYFYNLTDNAGDGYGEMRDFMNMHDLFYYIIPMLKEGVDLTNLYNDTFGLYIDEDCSISFTVDNSVGVSSKFIYDGEDFTTLAKMRTKWQSMTEEERYKFWHSYNTYTILLNYTAWLGTMMDCNYADSETISIMGDRFTVTEPLNPYTYFETDADGNITKGRLMVFSRSEMAYYGLTEADLTTVEQKIIDLQDNVYAATLDIMNYYTLSDETLIQAYAMIQTFEFNKIFSQDSLVGESFTLYPQGYELKGFSYDAYLRMIIAEASGEPIMSGGIEGDDGVNSENSSIYKRVLENTSLFFALFLLINDILAVYLIPGLKLFFIVCIFITSVLIIIGSAIKMELNMFKVMWQSLFAPLLSFAGISMGMSLLVSMFMGDGANGVVQSSATIDLGDPTATIIVMIIINAGVTILYFKVCKKCFHDLKTYGKAIFDNIGSTVVGAVGTVTSAISGGSARDRLLRRGGGSSNVAGTAKQRGQDNMPSSGKTGVGTGAVAGGALGAGMASDLLSKDEKRQGGLDAKRRDESLGMNKYDKTAFNGANKKSDDLLNQAERLDTRAQNAKGLNKKRLAFASELKQRRAVDHANYAENVKNHGKLRAGFMQVGYHGKNVGSSLKFGANKAKAGASRIGNTLSSRDTYVKLGQKAGQGYNGARNAVGKVKKGGQRVVSEAKNLPNTVRNAPNKSKAMLSSAVGKGRNSLKKAGQYGATAVKNTSKTVVKAGANTAKAVGKAGKAIGEGFSSVVKK